MAKGKETAKRASILIATIAFIFSSLAGTILFFMQSKDEQSQLSQQEEILKQLKEQENCSSELADEKKVEPAPTVPQNPSVEKITELKTEDLTVGDGVEVKAGDCILLFFHGSLAKDGKVFDGGSNYADAIPYRSTTTGFIPGFSKGLVGMKAGGERRIFIPSSEGYGSQANGEIPANSDLIFTVKVVEVVQKQ